MKRIIALLTLTFAILVGVTLPSEAQTDDCQTTAVGVHYVAPLGASLGMIRTGQFQVGMDLAYKRLWSPVTKEDDSYNYSFDLLTYAGVRVYHKEYRTAIYAGLGYLFNDLEGLTLYCYSKLMLLRGQKAFAIEPYYAHDPGLRIGIYLRI